MIFYILILHSFVPLLSIFLSGSTRRLKYAEMLVVSMHYWPLKFSHTSDLPQLDMIWLHRFPCPHVQSWAPIWISPLDWSHGQRRGGNRTTPLQLSPTLIHTPYTHHSNLYLHPHLACYERFCVGLIAVMYLILSMMSNFLKHNKPTVGLESAHYQRPAETFLIPFPREGRRQP